MPANKTIGFYDATCVTQGCALGSLQPILGAGSVNGNIANQFNSQLAGATNLGANPGFANYGFYMTSCDLSAGLSPTCITTFSNSALNQGTTPSELTHQHMALFQNAQNARLFYIGFEDGRAGDSIEAAGDYNDVVFGFSTSAAAAAAPEPATYSIMGLGLAGLGLIRRFRK